MASGLFGEQGFRDAWDRGHRDTGIHPDEVCAGCGCPRYAHRGLGPCLSARAKTKEAEGTASHGSVCPCTAFEQATVAA
jgi:hypothetical protein